MGRMDHATADVERRADDTLGAEPLQAEHDANDVDDRIQSANLMEITLQLQIQRNGKVVATDTCTLTVTPVLTSFTIVATKGTAPDLVDDPILGSWALETNCGPPGVNAAFTYSAAAQWQATTSVNGLALVRGDLRFIQDVQMVNNLTVGGKAGWGADLGPRAWDFAAPFTGNWLCDSDQQDVPFQTLKENLTITGGVAANSVQDTPKLPLEAGPGLIWLRSVLPAVGQTTNVDVTYSFNSYAMVSFSDHSLYALGQQSWNVRYAGAVTQPKAKTYNFTPAGKNANNGSGAFGAGVLNNGNPPAIGPTIGNGQPPEGGGLGWR